MVVRPWPAMPNLIQFFSQDFAPKCSLIAAQCKGKLIALYKISFSHLAGLILDEDSKDFSAVSFPFLRFASDNDDAEQMVKINWEESFVSGNILIFNFSLAHLEKIHGLSFSLFWYHDEWKVSFIHSNNPMSAFPTPTLHQALELFFETWKAKGYKWPGSDGQTDFECERNSKSYTYSFLLSPRGPLDAYSTHRLVLVGMRNIFDYQELLVSEEDSSRKLRERLGWEILQFFEFQTLPGYTRAKTDFEYKQLLENYAISHPISIFQAEGFLVVDTPPLGSKVGAFHRYLCRTKSYKCIAELGRYASHSEKRRQFLSLALVALQSNVKLEDIELFPEWEPWINFILTKLRSFCSAVDYWYSQLSTVEGDKEFSKTVAQVVSDKKYHPYLFSLRKQKYASAIELVQSIRPISKIYKILFSE